MSPKWEPDPDVRSAICNLHAYLHLVAMRRRCVFIDQPLHRCEEIERNACADPRESKRQKISARIRRYPWRRRFWPPSYFAGLCGRMPLSVIKEHIDQQNRPDRQPAVQAGFGSSLP